MAYEWADVVAIMEMRQSQDSALVEKMIEVQARYDGDLTVPLPEMDTGAVLPNLTPALVAETIDNHALRAASVRPMILCPPLTTSDLSMKRATTRTKAVQATLYNSRYHLQLRRTYRHLSGYATATFNVAPDYSNEIPLLEVRNPLGCYPEPRAAEDMTPVSNCGFIYERSATWLRSRFPASKRENGGPIGEPGRDDELWEIVEWIDDDSKMFGIIGPKEEGGVTSRETRRSGGVCHLQLGPTLPNRAGRCTVVTMPRISLNKVASQIANQLGTIDMLAKMQALSVAADERAVFPDRYAIARPGESPRIISNDGNWADGRTGSTNLLEGVQAVGQLDSASPQSTGRIISDLERNARVSMGLVPQFGGESYGALRTGRGMDSLMQAAIDPRVQELQEIVEVGLSYAAEIMLDTWKGCFSGKTHTVFSGWGGRADLSDLTPETDIETSRTLVTYAIAGTEMQTLTLQLGQMLGAKAISLSTFRRKHPLVEDPEEEARQIDDEDFEMAAREATLQRAVAGELPLTQLAMIAQHRKAGMDIFDAITKADEEMRELQAQEVPEVPETGPEEPNMQAPPEMMPGLGGPAAPGQAPQVPQQQIGPTPDQAGMQDLLSALRAAG